VNEDFQKDKPVVCSLQWRHKARINYQWGPYRHTIQRNITLCSSNSDKNCRRRCILKKLQTDRTRMVQLPATAAIEYVAACCITRTRTITKTVLGAYARSPQVQCIYAPSRLSEPSILAWRTNKKNDKKTKKTDKLGLLAPRGVDPPPQIFRVCRGGCTLHISSKHYMGPTPVYGARPKNPSKMPILPWSKRIYVALAAT